MVERIVDVPGFSHLEKVGVLAYALAKDGRIDDAKALLKKEMESPTTKLSTQRGMVGAAYDAVGDREKAIAVLRAAVDDSDLWLAHYLSAAPYDRLRKDPRARALFARISAR